MYPAREFPQKPRNKSFIDHAYLVKMSGYWPCSFLFSNFMDHKHAKKELGQYPAILTSHVVNNPYISTTEKERVWHLLVCPA